MFLKFRILWSGVYEIQERRRKRLGRAPDGERFHIKHGMLARMLYYML